MFDYILGSLERFINTLAIIACLGIVSILAWIGFGIYHLINWLF